MSYNTHNPTAYLIPGVALTGLLVLSGTILYAMTSGNFLQEGRLLTDMPWGIVTLVDIYVGFMIFACWIAYREQFTLSALFWIAALLVLGNLVSCIYLLLAAVSSRGDMKTLLMGKLSNRDVEINQ